MKNKFGSALMLLLAAFIWGIAFVAQKEGTQNVGPFTFNGVRMILGSVALLPVIAIMNLKNKKSGVTAKTQGSKKDLFIGGALCGGILFTASSFQQLGLTLGADAGTSGFITALYIVLVPVVSVFFKKNPGLRVWISIIIALVGLAFLCLTSDLSFKLADLLVVVCAFCFTAHILVISYFSPKVDGVKLSCIQFFVCGVLSLITMAFLETPDVNDILNAYVPILYTGILSSGVAYTLQIIGQKNLDPSVASILMSFESVFAVLAGLVWGETLTLLQSFGCVLMFIAIILTQLPVKAKNKPML
ncbi:MAG: DMT family transporter [Clostridia bacterium]|nr:DMT family transporter [Clostridia bacterium]